MNGVHICCQSSCALTLLKSIDKLSSLLDYETELFVNCVIRSDEVTKLIIKKNRTDNTKEQVGRRNLQQRDKGTVTTDLDARFRCTFKNDLSE